MRCAMGCLSTCVARSDHAVVLFGEMLVICQHEILFLLQDLASGSGYFQVVSLQWSGMVSAHDVLA